MRVPKMVFLQYSSLTWRGLKSPDSPAKAEISGSPTVLAADCHFLPGCHSSQ